MRRLRAAAFLQKRHFLNTRRALSDYGILGAGATKIPSILNVKLPQPKARPLEEFFFKPSILVVVRII
jgi:hypothetical protein